MSLSLSLELAVAHRAIATHTHPFHANVLSSSHSARAHALTPLTSTHLLVTLTHSASHGHTHPSPSFTQICGHTRIDHGNVHIPPLRLSCGCDHTHPSPLEGVFTRTLSSGQTQTPFTTRPHPAIHTLSPSLSHTHALTQFAHHALTPGCTDQPKFVHHRAALCHAWPWPRVEQVTMRRVRRRFSTP